MFNLIYKYRKILYFSILSLFANRECQCVHVRNPDEYNDSLSKKQNKLRKKPILPITPKKKLKKNPFVNPKMLASVKLKSTPKKKSIKKTKQNKSRKKPILLIPPKKKLKTNPVKPKMSAKVKLKPIPKKKSIKKTKPIKAKTKTKSNRSKINDLKKQITELQKQVKQEINNQAELNKTINSQKKIIAKKNDVHKALINSKNKLSASSNKFISKISGDNYSKFLKLLEDNDTIKDQNSLTEAINKKFSIPKNPLSWLTFTWCSKGFLKLAQNYSRASQEFKNIIETEKSLDNNKIDLTTSQQNKIEYEQKIEELENQIKLLNVS